MTYAHHGMVQLSVKRNGRLELVYALARHPQRRARCSGSCASSSPARPSSSSRCPTDRAAVYRSETLFMLSARQPARRAGWDRSWRRTGRTRRKATTGRGWSRCACGQAAASAEGAARGQGAASVRSDGGSLELALCSGPGAALALQYTRPGQRPRQLDAGDAFPASKRRSTKSRGLCVSVARRSRPSPPRRRKPSEGDVLLALQTAFAEPGGTRAAFSNSRARPIERWAPGRLR